MATNKRLTDLTDYKSVLPYSSEIFGVYQPLLGWRGKRNTERIFEKAKIATEISKSQITSDSFQPNLHVITSELSLDSGNSKNSQNFVQELSIFSATDNNTGSLFLNEIRKMFDGKFQEKKAEKSFNRESFDKILDGISLNILDDYKKEFVENPQKVTSNLYSAAKEEEYIRCIQYLH